METTGSNHSNRLLFLLRTSSIPDGLIGNVRSSSTAANGSTGDSPAMAAFGDGGSNRLRSSPVPGGTLKLGNEEVDEIISVSEDDGNEVLMNYDDKEF
ncbi:hypothetical protein L2E82_24512 [Cichorium intybus]|uniref:Uncharacterized protein n=1 Tax=Cichorium intybus TaxID=13427 RepID=A0ACB9E0P0_CICIN|nr:hypothetical protein L2E82_24512 [Cichorium intybus]